jgi:hypothetical protein
MTLLHRTAVAGAAAVILGVLVAATLLSTGVIGDAAAAGSQIRVTPAQLTINQRISQAAVRRSNAANKAIAGLQAGAATTAADIAQLKAQAAAPGPAATGALASGQTVRGAYNTGGTPSAANDLANTSISFVFALAAPPTVTIVQDGAPAPSQCPGTAAFPQAAPGNLCIYAESTANVAPPGLLLNGVTRSGATIYVFAQATGANFFSFGTWAVTAP